MSVHKLTTCVNGQQLTVQMGWDSPTQWFYLVITKDGEQCDPLYSHLDEPDPASKDLDYFLGICRDVGIVVPEAMIAGVRDDRETGAMNRLVMYDNKGYILYEAQL